MADAPANPTAGEPVRDCCWNCAHWQAMQENVAWGHCRMSEKVWALAVPLTFDGDAGRLKTHATFACNQFDARETPVIVERM